MSPVLLIFSGRPIWWNYPLPLIFANHAIEWPAGRGLYWGQDRSVCKLPCTSREMLKLRLHVGFGSCARLCRASLLKPRESWLHGGWQSEFPSPQSRLPYRCWGRRGADVGAVRQGREHGSECMGRDHPSSATETQRPAAAAERLAAYLIPLNIWQRGRRAKLSWKSPPKTLPALALLQTEVSAGLLDSLALPIKWRFL